MKVFALAPQEDWIVDRFVKEWNEDNSDISTSNATEADVIWLMADWCWSQISYDLLRSKKVLTTIHHIVPEKFQAPQLYEFRARDDITDAYHVPNNYTRDFIAPLTTKPIHVIPYWANQKIWKKTGTKDELRQKHRIPTNGSLVIGSFQRDTEGAGINQGIILPKLEKGPDIFADLVETLVKKKIVIHVVLAGWRRQYVISRLEKLGVNHSVFEKPSQSIINELYQTLDLYPVTARHEGGPQSLLECGLLNVLVISRPVGMALDVLEARSVRDDLTLASPTIPKIEHLKLPAGYEPYRRLLVSL